MGFTAAATQTANPSPETKIDSADAPTTRPVGKTSPGRGPLDSGFTKGPDTGSSSESGPPVNAGRQELAEYVYRKELKCKFGNSNALNILALFVVLACWA